MGRFDEVTARALHPSGRPTLEQQAVIPEDADNDCLDTQLRLALIDALELRDGADTLDCLIAHFERLFELWTVDQLLQELVCLAGTHHDGVDATLSMGRLLAGVEQIASNIAYWSRTDTSFTPEVTAYNAIIQARDAYAKAQGATRTERQ